MRTICYCARGRVCMSRNILNFERLVEAAPDAMVGIGPAGVIRFVNRQTELLFDYDRTDLIGQPMEILVPELSRKGHPAHRAGYFANPEARAMGTGLQFAGRRRDGTEFPADISLSPFGSGDDTVVIAAVRDVTEQRQAAEAVRNLAAAEDLVRTVMGSAPIGIVLAGLEGSFRFVNRALC